MEETITQQIKRQKLDSEQKSELILFLETELKKQVIGQHESSDSIADSMSRAIAGIRDKEKPILTLMFLGPTGVGKTETVKVLSNIIFGARDCFTRVNCEELSADHSLAKLIGSPPGYVGNDVEAMLSQKQLDKHFHEAHKYNLGLFASDNPISEQFNGDKENGALSIVLFDEIEKAHPKIWNALIGIMDDGHLTLGNNKTVDMKNSIIIMTSNVGAKELDKSLQQAHVGFDLGGHNDEQDREKEIKQMKEAAVGAAKELFPPEFCNRFDKIVTFKTLSEDDFSRILDIHIQGVYRRLMDADVPVFIHYKDDFMKMIMDKGVDKRYGARNLNRVIDQEIITPFSKLINTKQIQSGDIIEISMKGDKVNFMREPRFTKNVISRRKTLETKPRTRKRK